MHHEGALRQPGGSCRGQPEAGAVLADARDHRVGDPLALHAQQVEHVHVADDRVEVVGGSGQRCGRQQGLRGDEGDLGTEHREDLDGAARHPGVADVADDRHPQSVETTGPGERGAHGVGVEQCLGRMGVPAVAAVDDAGSRPPLDLPWHAARLVADDEGVDAHRRHRLDRVAEALSLVDARRPGGERHHIGRQPLGRRLERQPGSRRVLEEHVADRAPAQRRHLRVGPGVDVDHVVGEVEEALDRLDPDLGDRPQVFHDVVDQCERRGASRGAASNGLRGRGTQ